VSERELALAQQGLDAWRRGDLSVIEEMLDPSATWRWFEPGDWDCENREDIVRTLRERYDQGFGEGRMELVDGGPGKVIAVSRPREIGGEEWPAETATVISFREGKVVSMKDYRTRDEALAAARKQ
jgi:ketosteroid isomerase-like protein